MAAAAALDRELLREELREELRQFAAAGLRDELAVLGARVRADAEDVAAQLGRELREAMDSMGQRRAWFTPRRVEVRQETPGGLASVYTPSPPSPVSKEGERPEHHELARFRRLSPAKLAACSEVGLLDDRDLEACADESHEWTHRHPKGYTAGAEEMLQRSDERLQRQRQKWRRGHRRVRSTSSDPGSGPGAGAPPPPPGGAQLGAARNASGWSVPPQPHKLQVPCTKLGGCGGPDTHSRAVGRPASAARAGAEGSPASLDSPGNSDMEPPHSARALCSAQDPERQGSAPMQFSKPSWPAMRSDSKSLKIYCNRDLSCMDKLYLFVSGVHFDYLASVIVVLNAITLGMQTEYMATHVKEDLPKPFRDLELLFCALFTAELALRIFVLRSDFCRSNEWRWNAFDLVLVGLQLGEEVLRSLLWAASAGHGPELRGLGPHVTVMRSLRLLRLVRIIRLVRVMRVIGELRMLVMSIFGCMKSLCWAVVLLFLMIYMVAVYFTQLVGDHHAMLADRGEADKMAPELLLYYGSLGRTILSLYEAVTGGIDWDVAVVPLMSEISPWVALVFSLYVAFAILAMMNVVTGVFMETALMSAKKDRDIYMVNHVRELFHELDLGNTGMLTWAEIEAQMNTKAMQEYFRAIDVDVSEARGLFKLLDLNDSGVINAEDFLNGCIRIRGPARALETMLLLRETTRLAERQLAHARRVEGLLETAHGAGGAMSAVSDDRSSRRTSPLASQRFFAPKLRLGFVHAPQPPPPQMPLPAAPLSQDGAPLSSRAPLSGRLSATSRSTSPSASVMEPSPRLEEPNSWGYVAPPQRPTWRLPAPPEEELLRKAEL